MMAHMKLSQLLGEKNNFDRMAVLQTEQNRVLNNLITSITKEIEYEIKHKIPNWSIQALTIGGDTYDKERISIDIVSLPITQTTYQVVGTYPCGKPHLAIYIRPNNNRPYDMPQKLSDSRLKDGQVIETRVDTSYDYRYWPGYEAFTKIHEVQRLLCALDNGVWTSLELCIKRKLEEYKQYPIFETKQSVRLILAHWKDTDCVLAQFPRDVIRLICTMVLRAYSDLKNEHNP
jgi:hypothetical protein